MIELCAAHRPRCAFFRRIKILVGGRLILLIGIVVGVDLFLDINSRLDRAEVVRPWRDANNIRIAASILMIMDSHLSMTHDWYS